MCEHINIFDTTNINHTSYVITSRYECSKSTVSFIYIFFIVYIYCVFLKINIKCSMISYDKTTNTFTSLRFYIVTYFCSSFLYFQFSDGHFFNFICVFHMSTTTRTTFVTTDNYNTSIKRILKKKCGWVRK